MSKLPPQLTGAFWRWDFLTPEIKALSPAYNRAFILLLDFLQGVRERPHWHRKEHIIKTNSSH